MKKEKAKKKVKKQNSKKDKKEKIIKNFDNETIIEDKNFIDNSNPENLAFSIPINKTISNKKNTKASSLFKSFVETIKASSNNIEVVNFKSKLVKFSAILTNRSFRFKLLIIFLTAMVTGFLTLLLVKNSGLYSLGINGVFQGIAKIVKTSMNMQDANPNTIELIYNLIYWISNVLFNIPLAFFAYKKISKRFAYLTIIYIVFSQMFGLAFDYIPGITDIHIFGSTNNWSNIIENINVVGDLPLSTLEKISFSNWGSTGTLSLFVYCVFNGLLIGINTSFVLMIGGSTGGTDVFGMYYARKKNKPIGLLLLLFNNACLFTSTIIGTFGSICIVNVNIVTHIDANNQVSSVIQSLLSPNYVFSVVMSVISGLMIDFIFPKAKFVQIKIYTDDANKLKQNLLLTGYSHDMYINKITNAITMKEEFTIETICMYIELPNVLNSIRSIDTTSLISINKLQDIDGNMKIIK